MPKFGAGKVADRVKSFATLRLTRAEVQKIEIGMGKEFLAALGMTREMPTRKELPGGLVRAARLVRG